MREPAPRFLKRCTGACDEIRGAITLRREAVAVKAVNRDIFDLAQAVHQRLFENVWRRAETAPIETRAPRAVEPDSLAIGGGKS